MKYTVTALPKVNRTKKKLPRSFQEAISTEVAEIAENPFQGQPKKGDLAGVWVHKFKYHDILVLIGYLINSKSKTITILAIGPHENFYRDLKRYLRN